jgi:hypothetical protein
VAVAFGRHRRVPAQAGDHREDVLVVGASTAGGAEAGAMARPLGSSLASGTAASALAAVATSAAVSSPQTARMIAMPLRMKDRYRQISGQPEGAYSLPPSPNLEESQANVRLEGRRRRRRHDGW